MKYINKDRLLSGRSGKIADNILGVIHNQGEKLKCRSSKLKTVEQYLNNTIYDGLMDWDQAKCGEDFTPVKKRKPKIVGFFFFFICTIICPMSCPVL